MTDLKLIIKRAYISSDDEWFMNGYILIECGYMFAIAPDQLQMNLVDIVIIHGIVLLDVLDKELITYAIRVR